MLQDNADSGVLGKVQGLVNAGIKWLTTGRKRRGVLTSMQGTSLLRPFCAASCERGSCILQQTPKALSRLGLAPARLALQSCMLGLRRGLARDDGNIDILTMPCSGGFSGHAKETGGRV